MENVTLCSLRYALEEARTNLTVAAQKKRLAVLAETLELVEARAADLPKDVLLPEKDLPILRAAITARATHWITGDLRHFGRYFGTALGGVLVLSPAGYLKMRRLS